jgi:hypothetical protein
MQIVVPFQERAMFSCDTAKVVKRFHDAGATSPSGTSDATQRDNGNSPGSERLFSKASICRTDLLCQVKNLVRRDVICRRRFSTSTAA